MCDSTLWTWLWTHSHANTWTQKILSAGMAVMRKKKQTIFLLLYLLVQKTETETLLATPLAIHRSRVQGTQNESPGHAAQELALVRALIFAILILSFMLQNIQVCAITGESCSEYLPADVQDQSFIGKCFCFTTKPPLLSVDYLCFSTLLWVSP